MTKFALALPAIALLIATASCRDFSGESHMQQMSAMKDSIFKIYPHVASVLMNVQNQALLVTLGSKSMAAYSTDQRQKLANELGAMTLRLFGKDKSPEQEKLIITPNERNDLAEPGDGVTTVINMDSLQKAMNH